MKNIFTLIILILLGTKADAQIIINELLINEPGTSRNLEWFELYNNSDYSESLSDYEIYVDGTIVSVSLQIVLQPSEYLVICRKLFSENNQTSFEKLYGNNSNVWGDTITEQYSRQPVEAVFSLLNSQGSISLFRNNDRVSYFSWTEGGADGISWERLNSQDSLFLQSSDQSGATPGFINSISSVDYDLAIDSSWVAKENDRFLLFVNISNVGLQPVEYSVLYLILSSDTISFSALPLLNPYETYTVEFYLKLPGYYTDVSLKLSKDNRHSNNYYFITVPGGDYPSVILSEFFANPPDDLNSEWIEIKNRSDSLISLSNWQIIDDAGNKILLSGIIEPNEYLVLVQDKAEFEKYYFNNLISIIEPESWAVLNNNSETVTLVDHYGLVSDYFEYENSFPENYSWARDEFQPSENIWGRSVDAFGTPGFQNELYPIQSDSINIITITPTHFSPVDDELITITVQAVNAENYSAGIYNRTGQKIKTFFDKQSFIPSEFNWDGLSDGNRQLPVGVYLFYFEAEGSKPIKKPIVITR